MQTSLWLVGALLVSLLFLVSPTQPRDYSSQPIELRISTGPGSEGKMLARYLAEHLPSHLDVPVMLMRGSGADSLSPLEPASNPGKGVFVLALMNGGGALTRALEQRRMDPRRLRYLALVRGAPLVLVVPQNSPIRSYAQFLKAAQSDADSLRVGTTGYGALANTAIRRLGSMGYGVRNIPHALPGLGSQPDTNADTHAHLGDLGRAAPLLTLGELRALAVFQQHRHPAFPHVPATGEYGQSFALDRWWALVAGPEVPAEVVLVLNRALARVTDSPEWQRFCQRTLSHERVLRGVNAREFALSRFERAGRPISKN